MEIGVNGWRILSMEIVHQLHLNEHVANKRGVAGPPKNGDRK